MKAALLQHGFTAQEAPYASLLSSVNNAHLPLVLAKNQLVLLGTVRPFRYNGGIQGHHHSPCSPFRNAGKRITDTTDWDVLAHCGVGGCTARQLAI
jgi:hypothetical protein